MEAATEAVKQDDTTLPPQHQADNQVIDVIMEDADSNFLFYLLSSQLWREDRSSDQSFDKFCQVNKFDQVLYFSTCEVYNKVS